jgi:hypothetical protein
MVGAIMVPTALRGGGAMAERRKAKVLAAIPGKGRRGPRRPRQWPDTAEALAALTRAWTVTVFASLFFVAALAVSQVWDGAVFLAALRDALRGDPQLVQPIDDISGTGSADGENPWTR